MHINSEQKKYILENINKKSVKEISNDLHLKERVIKRFLEKERVPNGAGGREVVQKMAYESAKTSVAWEPGRFIGILLLTLAVTAVILSYSNSLRGEFVLDDHPMIDRYDLVKNIKNIPKTFISSTSVFGTKNYYRPIQTISYILDYAVWKTNFIGFHISNVLFHVAAIVAIYFFINMLFGNKLYGLLTVLFLVPILYILLLFHT